MECKLKFFPLLSLKEIALRRVAVLLWCDLQVFAAISEVDPRDVERTVWRTIEDTVLVKVSKLQLPEVLRKQVLALVPTIRLEISRWMKFRYRLFGTYSEAHGGLPGSTKLFWTSSGKIDYAKTAKELCCNAVDVVKHYEIACEYCLEDCIEPLWEKLPETAKEDFSNQCKISRGLCYQWPHILKGDFSKLNNWSREKWCLSFNRYWFKDSIVSENRSVAKYFSSKITRKEREVYIRRAINRLTESVFDMDLFDGECEFFRYLLTLMTHEEQLEVLRVHPVPVFLSFLDPVWPDLFSENASLLFAHLTPSHYAPLLQKMVNKYDWKDFFSPQSFGDFLKQSPLDLKRFLVEQEDELGNTPAYHFLFTFFRYEDSECVEALFRNLDAEDRARVVFQREVVSLFCQSILNEDQEPMDQLCLLEVALSEGERERLKELMLPMCYSSEQMLRIKRFFRFLDELDASADEEKRDQKRKLENCSPEQ